MQRLHVIARRREQRLKLGQPCDLDALDLTDPRVYALLSRKF